MIDTTRATVEPALRLAVTNRHITPAVERLALALLDRAETAEAEWGKAFEIADSAVENMKKASERRLSSEAERDELAAAIDSIETMNGLTSNGNLWRFWQRQAKEHVGISIKARAERDALQAEVARLREAASMVFLHGSVYRTCADREFQIPLWVSEDLRTALEAKT